MSGFENWPAPILRRWLLSAAAGPVIFLIGLAGRIALHDPTLLTLSTLLASCIDEFIAFIEKNEWSFGGGYKTIIDGYYMNGDGTRGKSILDE